MLKEETYTELGAVRIHDNVIVCIASIATQEVTGVKAIEKDFRSGILQLLNRKNTGAIRVEKDKNGEISLDIPVIIKYGFNIPEVADRIQEGVRRALETMTNLVVKNININVQRVEVK